MMTHHRQASERMHRVISLVTREWERRGLKIPNLIYQKKYLFRDFLETTDYFFKAKDRKIMIFLDLFYRIKTNLCRFNMLFLCN
jgi:hypothetical protein